MEYGIGFWLLLIVFLISVTAIVYSYALYPWLIFLLSRKKKLRLEQYQEDDELPFVSLIISAFNEERLIGEKIQSVYQTNYPGNRFEVLIGSDASTDKTDEILQKVSGKYPSLHYFKFPERRGKGNVMNDLYRHARGDVIVFTDANVMFEKQTLRELIRFFKDQRIGLVDSQMINTNTKEEGISYQEKSYISREVKIKHSESILWGTMMGPFGGCFALRRKLFVPVPKNFLVDDFYINMKVLEAGYLCINNPGAKVYEEVPSDLGAEFRRKKRIATGNFQNLRAFTGMLWHKTPGLSFSYISHKVLRWLGPFFMLIAIITNAALAFYHQLFMYLFILHLVLTSLPFIDYLLKKSHIHNRTLRFISHFYGMNLAMFLGFFKSLKKIETNVWKPTERKS